MWRKHIYIKQFRTMYFKTWFPILQLWAGQKNEPWLCSGWQRRSEQCSSTGVRRVSAVHPCCPLNGSKWRDRNLPLSEEVKYLQETFSPHMPETVTGIEECTHRRGKCRPSEIVTQLIKIRVDSIHSWYRANQPRFKECAPLVHQYSLSSHVILGKTKRTNEYLKGHLQSKV